VISLDYSDLMKIEYIYLHSIEEPEENHLRLIFERCKVNPNQESIQISDKAIDGLHSIDVDYNLSFIGFSIVCHGHHLLK
jgi:hypothetical protein